MVHSDQKPTARRVSAVVRGAAVYELSNPIVSTDGSPMIYDRVIVSSANGGDLETRVFPTYGEVRVLGYSAEASHSEALASMGFEVSA